MSSSTAALKVTVRLIGHRLARGASLLQSFELSPACPELRLACFQPRLLVL